MKKILGSLMLLAVSVASAADSYRVSLYQKSVVNGTEFKPGDCKLELVGDKVILKQGKTSTELPVKVESANDKFLYTTVAYESGTNSVKEIVLGGTTKKLLVAKDVVSSK